MAVYRIPAVPGKFKKGQSAERKKLAGVTERINAIKARRAATAQDNNEQGKGKR
jgi:hypothetical protein